VPLVKVGVVLKRVVDTSVVAVMTAASFTFFAQLPSELDVRSGWDLKAKYQGWPDKNSEARQDLTEQFIMKILQEQANQLTSATIADFRELIKELRSYKNDSGEMDVPRLLAFDRIDALASGRYAVPVVPDAGGQTPDSSRNLLLALSESIGNQISGAVGGMAGSDADILIRFLKAVVELSAERLLEAKFDCLKDNTSPFNLKTLLHASVVGDNAAGQASAGAGEDIDRTVMDAQMWETTLGHHKVLAFGTEKAVIEGRIWQIRVHGGDPLGELDHDGRFVEGNKGRGGIADPDISKHPSVEK
jgi:hypothetical protein